MTLLNQVEQRFHDSFGNDPEVVARAPGRIEFIGNHTDYNGGTVLGAAIDRSVFVAVGPRDDGQLVLVSDFGARVSLAAKIPLVPLEGEQAWVNYPLGVLLALEKRGFTRPVGLNLAVASDVPLGAGLSSSAALELASGLALCGVQGFSLPMFDLVHAGREAENEFVGVPCGILDQGVSGFGRRDSLVHIDCRGPSFSTIPMPTGVQFWIFNTHARHALVESLYATRHGECMEAVRLVQARQPSVASLADLNPDTLAAARDLLPPVVFRRAWHVVQEIARVNEMGDVLKRGDLKRAGELLFESHESSRHQFENSTPELDFLVDTLRGRSGVHGARLTGGGFGGAVMAMTNAAFDADAANLVAQAYHAKFGLTPDVLNCATSAGAELLRS